MSFFYKNYILVLIIGLLDYEQVAPNQQTQLVYQYQPTYEGNDEIVLNTNPVMDKEGKTLVTDGNYFHFFLDASLKEEEEIPYGIMLSKDPKSTLADNDVKIYLTEIINGQEYPISTTVDEKGVVKTLAEIPQSDVLGEWYNYNLYETVAKRENGKDYHREYNLRVWVNSESGITPTVAEDGTLIYPYQGKQMTLRITTYKK